MYLAVTGWVWGFGGLGGAVFGLFCAVFSAVLVGSTGAGFALFVVEVAGVFLGASVEDLEDGVHGCVWGVLVFKGYF
jgi:hypothetical protein